MSNLRQRETEGNLQWVSHQWGRVWTPPLA